MGLNIEWDDLNDAQKEYFSQLQENGESVCLVMRSFLSDNKNLDDFLARIYFLKDWTRCSIQAVADEQYPDNFSRNIFERN